MEPRAIAQAVAPQPQLPSAMPSGEPWPEQTVEWWKQWGASPLTEAFTALEWHELLIAGVLHAAFWNGDVRVAAELRIRVAKFGVTPEDRLRLRIESAGEPTPAYVPPKRDLRLIEEG